MDTNKEKESPTEFKVAEIWIKSGNIHLEAVENFWKDKVPSLGILEICKDILKSNNLQDKNKRIITNGNGGIMNFVRKGFKR